MQLLEIDGYRFEVIAGGADRGDLPLVFLHGFAFSPRFWPLNLPQAMRDHYRWYSLSLPFHTPDIFRDTRREVAVDELFARLLSRAISVLVGDQPAILIGYSLGGFAALNLAARKPKQVRAVASISGFAAGPAEGIVGFWQRLVRWGPPGKWLSGILWKWAIASPTRFRVALSYCAAHPADFLKSPNSAATVEAMLPDLRRHDVRALKFLLDRLTHVDIGPMLPQIPAPTLLLAGRNDPIVSLHQQQTMAAAIPHCRVHVLENCGHMFFAECPTESAAVLVQWLSGQGLA